jgi:hypothetical protein
LKELEITGLIKRLRSADFITNSLIKREFKELLDFNPIRVIDPEASSSESVEMSSSSESENQFSKSIAVSVLGRVKVDDGHKQRYRQFIKNRDTKILW